MQIIVNKNFSDFKVRGQVNFRLGKGTGVVDLQEFISSCQSLNEKMMNETNNITVI